MKPLARIFPKLAIPKKIVITMPQAPDADAMGSSLGLYHFLVQLGHTVTVVSPTNWPDFLNWMPGCNLVLNYNNSLQKEKIRKAIQKADWLFCLDFNRMYRIKPLETIIKAASCTRILIDQHHHPEVESFHYGISNTAKSSTSEMVYDFIIASGHSDKIDNPMMECLYAGVMVDTGSFRDASAIKSVYNMIEYMISIGLNDTAVHENIYEIFMQKNQFTYKTCQLIPSLGNDGKLTLEIKNKESCKGRITISWKRNGWDKLDPSVWASSGVALRPLWEKINGANGINFHTPHKDVIRFLHDNNVRRANYLNGE